MKLSPRGSATAYIGANALISSAAAGPNPVLDGAFADFFAAKRLEIPLRWTSPGDVLPCARLQLGPALGLYTLRRLPLVKEADADRGIHCGSCGRTRPKTLEGRPRGLGRQRYPESHAVQHAPPGTMR